MRVAAPGVKSTGGPVLAGLRRRPLRGSSSPAHLLSFVFVLCSMRGLGSGRPRPVRPVGRQATEVTDAEAVRPRPHRGPVRLRPRIRTLPAAVGWSSRGRLRANQELAGEDGRFPSLFSVPQSSDLPGLDSCFLEEDRPRPPDCPRADEEADDGSGGGESGQPGSPAPDLGPAAGPNLTAEGGPIVRDGRAPHRPGIATEPPVDEDRRLNEPTAVATGSRVADGPLDARLQVAAHRLLGARRLGVGWLGTGERSSLDEVDDGRPGRSTGATIEHRHSTPSAATEQPPPKTGAPASSSAGAGPKRRSASSHSRSAARA